METHKQTHIHRDTYKHAYLINDTQAQIETYTNTYTNTQAHRYTTHIHEFIITPGLLTRALTRVLTGFRQVCEAERALHPLPCEAGSTLRGLYSVVTGSGKISPAWTAL